MVRSFKNLSWLFLLIIAEPCIGNHESEKVPIEVIVELDKDDYISVEVSMILEQCTRVIENRKNQDPATFAKALKKRGMTFLALERLDEAYKDLEELHRTKPNDLDVHLSLVVALIKQQKTQESIREALELKRLHPNSSKALSLFGSAVLQTGDQAGALEYANKAIKLDERQEDPYYLRALIFFERSDPVLCLENLNRYLTICPLAKDKDHSYPYFLRGLCYFQLNRPYDALSDFNVARRLNPSSMYAAWGLSRAYISLGKWHVGAHIAQQYTKLCKRREEMAVGKRLSAEASAEMGNVKDAIVHAQQALQLDVSPDTCVHVGIVYAKIGDYSKALDCYDKALSKEPEHMSALAHKASLLSTCLEKRLRNGKQALELAQKAINNIPEWQKWEARIALAEAYAELGKYQDAISVTKLALAQVQYSPLLKAQLEEAVKLFESQKPYRNHPRIEKSKNQTKPILEQPASN